MIRLLNRYDIITDGRTIGVVQDGVGKHKEWKKMKKKFFFFFWFQVSGSDVVENRGRGGFLFFSRRSKTLWRTLSTPGAADDAVVAAVSITIAAAAVMA